MKQESFDELMPLAAEYRPDTASAEWGFETRLLARVRELRETGEGSFFDLFADWLWRGALGLTPVVTAAAVVFFVLHGLSFSLPAGAEGLVGYLAGMLPGDLF